MAKTISFLQAINEAMAEEMRRDSSVFVLGEDVRIGPFGQTAGLVKEFGEERVLNTPIAENAITGVAMGAAMNGGRPVLELMFCDFTMLAMDQICNHLGQWRYITGNQYAVPITIRTAVGAGFRMAYGHSQCLESQLLQAPGLILVEPSTPHDAKGLLKSAIRSDDPVVFFEHKKLILGGVEGEAPEEEYTIPFGEAVIRKEGKDVTVVAFGFMVYEALNAAQELAQEDIDIEVIDPRTIVPLDQDTIFESVEKTGRLVTVEEGRIRGGLGAEMAALACGDYFSLLKAPVQRIAAPMVPIPGSPVLEDLYLPNKDSIVRAVKRTL
ncbi:MAG: alpha-ketoacid dehydrogenase subunit beta [Desulfobacterales bacterium]|jgi:pyruvate dehydrogenase E1 component beta subunit|nr:alpha-ketoacid dehydrogenase subunit beta [Desulfobacter sp.]MDP6683952.1 alpha-ketoacid dehydrogenase subunit beta [Desulfobacterales bacterium]MDP6808635.1 alpha-ketoacid dehydrogenase subunit beta [Desulfobacterales bacterium]|tara:strand:+ start:28891 stop:29865 length:975 start_codon:yes stop_codon:yes gene_type:complete